jgi:hypothetical protein
MVFLNSGRKLIVNPVFISKALPHQALEDDVYEGYYIPKGSTVLGNSW